MLNRHPPRHAHSHTRSHALRVTSCTSLLIVNPAERNFIFTLSHHPLLINVNQRLLHSIHCKYARPYLCWVVFFFLLGSTDGDGSAQDQPADTPPSRGAMKMIRLFGNAPVGLLMLSPSPATNGESFSGSEELQGRVSTS